MFSRSSVTLIVSKACRGPCSASTRIWASITGRNDRPACPNTRRSHMLIAAAAANRPADRIQARPFFAPIFPTVAISAHSPRCATRGRRFGFDAAHSTSCVADRELRAAIGSMRSSRSRMQINGVPSVCLRSQGWAFRRAGSEVFLAGPGSMLPPMLDAEALTGRVARPRRRPGDPPLRPAPA